MATNLLAPVGRQRAITDLGVVAPGALLHTYVSGTPNTPLGTTSDAAGLVPNANPLVASAGGLFGPIYLPPGVAYHFVLTDAGGLPIWDQDPVSTGASGNTVTGDLAVSGLVTVSGFGVHTISAPGVGAQQFIVRNGLAGVGNFAIVGVGNDTYSPLGYLAGYSSTYTASAYAQPNGLAILGLGPGGLSLVANDGAGVLRLYTGGATERLRIDAAGTVLINTTVAPAGAAARLGLVADLTAFNAVVLQNTGAPAGNFLLFVNSANTPAGSIQHNAASTVAYNTTSDRRLKTDHGRATDCAPLRALVIHDFTWTADGARDRGIFAQEAIALFPRAVTRGGDETTDAGHLARPWMTDYSKFMPDVIVGWQQHDAAIAELRAALAALKGAR